MAEELPDLDELNKDALPDLDELNKEPTAAVPARETVAQETPGEQARRGYEQLWAPSDLPGLWEQAKGIGNIVSGGVIVFDEYAYHSWSESNGADDFIKEMGLTLHTTGIKAPTAYIIKA